MPLNGGHTTFLLVFVLVLVFRCIRVVALNCEEMLETKGGGLIILYRV